MVSDLLTFNLKMTRRINKHVNICIPLQNYKEVYFSKNRVYQRRPFHDHFDKQLVKMPLHPPDIDLT